MSQGCSNLFQSAESAVRKGPILPPKSEVTRALIRHVLVGVVNQRVETIKEDPVAIHRTEM
jgi:hypothetical protein